MAKFNFYRSSVQVPLIVRPPGGSTARTSEALAEVIDIGPTLLDAAGAEPLEDARGHSLLPLIVNGGSQQQSNPRAVLFSEIQQQSRKAEAPTFRAVSDGHYRLTMETISGTACELFDLEEDPHELHNLVADPNLARTREQLAEQLAACISDEDSI